MKVDVCDKCKIDSFVADTRRSGDWVRRRRACKKCGAKWTTWETRRNPTRQAQEIRNERKKADRRDTLAGLTRRVEKQSQQVGLLTKQVEQLTLTVTALVKSRR